MVSDSSSPLVEGAWAGARQRYAAGGLLLGLAYFMLFFRLGSAPIQLWDEGRLAVNAAEMLARHQWLVAYYGQAPDLWNTKPPLMLWLQALSIRTLGYSALAVRLPAALAALATVLLVFQFGRRQLGHWLTGWLAALVLLTTGGFVAQHVARTGDYDALLVCWTTLGSLTFFRYLRTRRAGLAGLTALAFALAVLTKGVAGAVPLPMLLLFAALTGRLGWLLKRREAYAALALLVLVVAGYYGARERAAPGYLAAVLANEVSGRALQALESHHQPWDYYFTLLVDVRFTPWLAVAGLGLLLAGRQPVGSALRQFCLLAALLVGWQLLVISLMQTKLAWYDAPIYPWLALLAGVGLTQLYEAVWGHLGLRLPWWGPLALGLLLVGPPYEALRLQLDREHNQRFARPELWFGRYLPLQARQRPAISTYQVLDTLGYNASLAWYRLAQQATWHHHISREYQATSPRLQPGQTVVVCQPALRRQLARRFRLQLLFEQDSCATLRLVGPAGAP